MTALRSAITTAHWALRAYAGSTAVISVAAALALAGALPVVSLVAPAPLALPPPREAGLDVAWTGLAASPAVVQQRALTMLSGLLLAVAVAVLALAVLSVFTVCAARASARRSEIGVRRAVGASRRQLLASGLVEGVALAAIAVALGAPVGVAGARLAALAWPGVVAAGAFAPAIAAAAGLAATIVIGALFPVIPRRRRRIVQEVALPHGLAVPTVQLGFALTVLVAASQLARHAGTLVGDGRPAHAADGQIFEITMSPGAPVERAARYASLVAQAGTVFDLVSVTSPGATSGEGTVDVVTTECGRCFQGGIATPLRAVSATIAVVSADTFRAMGLRFVRGRAMGAEDGWKATPVAVVSRALAARHFEGGNPIGRGIRVGLGPADGRYTVVGVVEDQRPRGLGGGLYPPYTVYLSTLQRPPRAVDLLVRPRPAPRSVATAEQTVRESLGANAVIEGRVTEGHRREAEAAPIRWVGRLMLFEGTLALTIAMLGTFAAMHLWVNALIPELAVRRAVGARRRRILGFVLVRAAVVAVGGVAIALWVSELVSGTLAGVVAGLPARDAGLVLWPGLALVAAAFAGALVPAWRAARAAPAKLAAG